MKQFVVSSFLAMLANKNSCCVQAWTTQSSSSQSTAAASIASVSRRQAFQSAATRAFAMAVAGQSLPQMAAADETNPYRFERRDRNGNKDAVIREDYWYATGITPPRKLNSPLILDDPKWNTFGSCETSEGGSTSNSCTYISLKQRQPAYSKYGFSISLGAQEFQELKSILQKGDWKLASKYVVINPDTRLPPPASDAVLKMVLFASAMLVSPNFNGTSRELLVARFYVNEFQFALDEIERAIEQQNIERALAAWEFGADSFNSYTQVVNRQVSAKVGDPLPTIS